MPTTRANGVDIYYEEYGKGTPLLLVPGLGGTGSYWQPQIEAFSRDFRVIVHDHRGTGQSIHDTTIVYSVEQMASDLIGLMDAIGIKQAHLLGHSTGGAIGQVIAIDHPERLISNILYASWVKSDAFMNNVFEVRKTLLREGGASAYVKATPLFLYPDWWINENQTALTQLEQNSIDTFPSVEIAISRCDAVLNFDRKADLSRIKTPTMVLCAADDFLTPQYCSEQLAQQIPNAHLVTLDRGGHACSQTEAGQFNEVVLAWLTERDANGAVKA